MKHAVEPEGRDTHLSILLVAERLFAVVGFEKTTVADIAGELRLTWVMRLG